jgi:hypothetical protein
MRTGVRNLILSKQPYVGPGAGRLGTARFSRVLLDAAQMSQRDLNIAAIAAVIGWVGFCLYMGWF